MQDEYAQEELGGEVATPCIEDLVGKAAESKSDSDVEKLFNGLKGRELFLKTKEDNKDEIPIVKVNGSLSVFVLYTSEDDERLTTIYGGTPWESALNMLFKLFEEFKQFKVLKIIYFGIYFWVQNFDVF